MEPPPGSNDKASLFDGYLVVDWSAASQPKTGANSIWIAWLPVGGALTLRNPPTRLEAMEQVAGILDKATTEGHRLLAAFDFPFGYPTGTVRALTGSDDWRKLWALIAKQIDEGPKNANNRFDAAASLNTQLCGEGPFWGNGLKRDIDGLPRTCPTAEYETRYPSRKRHAETIARRAQEVWKLNGVGSVGGQALTGIAALERLRNGRELAVWPFETLGEGNTHVLAEVYPSLIEPHAEEKTKDAGQVRAFAEALASADSDGRLATLMSAPRDMPPEVRREEAAMLGMGQVNLLTTQPTSTTPLHYKRDPEAIYAQSFATARREARLERFGDGMQVLATRLIHACGMVEIADWLVFSSGACEAGRAALQAGAPVLCDCEMAAAGIVRRLLPGGNEVIVTLNDASVAGRAEEIGNTRSAAAVEFWRDHLDGAVVAIGNAPTALFHLLELLDAGWPKPALILGFPVGFVGAAESKAELAANPRGCDFIALRGRRGGSALAAAAVNALASAAAGGK